MAVEFSPAAKAKFEQYLTRYPIKRAAIMPTLWLAQEEFGWLSNEMHGVRRRAARAAAGVRRLRRVVLHHVLQAADRAAPRAGVHQPLVRAARRRRASSTACAQRLGIGVGETTADGRFSLSEVECLGSCGTAPMMQVNDDFWENLTPERTLELIDRLARD